MDKKGVVDIARESKFQKKLKDDIRELFPGAVVTKMDANDIQGIPDLLVIWFDKWALLECKESRKASKRPNQDYYVNMFRTWSYSAFVYPENKEEILDELQSAFKSSKPTRIPKR